VPAPETARRNYNRLSRWYDRLAGGFEARFRDVGLVRLAARPGESVLELGPGTGLALLALAQDVGPAGRVAAIDISEQMLDRCRRRLDRAGVLDRVELRQGDARKLPWPDHCFDAAFASFAMETFAPASLAIVLAELRRVLKPGGRICVTAMSADGRDTLMMHLYRWSHRLLPKLVDCAPISLASLLGQAGFEVRNQEVENRWGLNVAVAVGLNG
jgi:demethylmenaquinone methyltransferase / 2-methoxy-6-polyprenyl-1,4-benzoquinol methylase